MKRKSAHPPVLILMDLLFILVFILLINTDDNVKINIPLQEPFTGSYLVYKHDGVENIVDHISGKVTSDTLDKGKYYYYQKCERQCDSLNINDRDNMFIYFPDDLFKSVAQISYIATNTSYNCKNLEFDITEEGNIDHNLLFTKNPCLGRIPGSEFLK